MILHNIIADIVVKTECLVNFFLCIKKYLYVNNETMKYPKERKYGSNSDERESLFPEQFDLQNKNTEISKK